MSIMLRPSGVFLTPAGKDRWTALDGSYTAERRTESGGWAYGGPAFLVTAVRLPAADKARYLWCASLDAVLDAITAHSQAGAWPAERVAADRAAGGLPS